MWESNGMAARVARVIAAAGLVAGTIVARAPGAGANGLPIASVSVSTPTPTVGEPFTVTVRFRPGEDYFDAGWEDYEIRLLTAARADAQGWPQSHDDLGKPIPIRRVAFGVFRGTAVVRTPGDYVVLDGSTLSARSARALGVVHPVGGSAAPVRVHVIPPHRARSAPLWLIVGAIVAGLTVLVLAATARRRKRQTALRE